MVACRLLYLQCLNYRWNSFSYSSFLWFFWLGLWISEQVNSRSARDLFDWSQAAQAALFWKRITVCFVDIVPVARNWVLGYWVETLNWWSVRQLNLLIIKLILIWLLRISCYPNSLYRCRDGDDDANNCEFHSMQKFKFFIYL